MKIFFALVLFFSVYDSSAQSSYKDSIEAFIKNYVDSHEVVKGEDRQHLHFFDVNEKYRVVAQFEKSQTNQ